MRQIVRLTESDLHNLIRYALTEAIDEISKDTALSPMTIYRATDRMIQNNQFSMVNKKGKTIKTNKVRLKSRKLSDRAIMHYVIQNMEPSLSFDTIDKTHPNGHIGIEFQIEEIKEYTDKEMLLYGLIVTSNWKGWDRKHGVIKCVFGNEGKDAHSSNFKFYLVQTIGNTVKTPSVQLLDDPDNEAVIRQIISNIYKLRQEAEDKSNTITDLSNYELNGNLNLKSTKVKK